MEFNLETEVCINLPNRDNFFVKGFVNNYLDIFAICKYSITDDYDWSLVHRTSGVIILSIFKRKKDVELYLKLISKEKELNSLEFLTPHSDDIYFIIAPFLGFYMKHYKKFRRSP